MKLEVGKFYRTRDGRKSGPVEHGYCEKGVYKFKAELDGLTRYYSSHGEYYPGQQTKHGCDLIAEWADEPTTPEAPASPQPAGPVRTITRKEVVSGVYGAVTVRGVNDAGVGLVFCAARLSTAELRDAIATLSEIADAMEENSK